jgi:hypothetical protein
MNFPGRNTRSARITPQDVRDIRRRYGEGETQAFLSRAFGVSVIQIGRIVRGESWQWVEGVPEGGLQEAALRSRRIAEEWKEPPDLAERQRKLLEGGGIRAMTEEEIAGLPPIDPPTGETAPELSQELAEKAKKFLGGG